MNFLEHASPGGQIPIMMTADNADAFRIVAKSETSRNQAKPVFGQLGLLASDQRGDARWLEPHFDGILRFYDSWVKNNSSPIGLLVWGDDVAIGDDNDPTTFGRPFFSSANLLLNCLFYQDLLASAELAQRIGTAGRSAPAFRAGRGVGAPDRKILLGSQRQLLLHRRCSMCRPASGAYPIRAARNGHVVEVPSVEDPDVHRVPAALVRHRD